MEAMFRPSFNVWSLADWPLASFWLSFTRVNRCQVKCMWIRILAVCLTFDYHENRLSLYLMEMNYFRSSARINLWTSVVKHLCDLFLLTRKIDMSSYADDATPCVCVENISSIIESLEKASNLLFQWFSDNRMKTNEENCHWAS